MRDRFRHAAMVFALAINLAYLIYRARYSLNWQSPYGIFASLLLYGAEVHCLISLGLFFLQIWQPTELEPPDPMQGRSVDVFVPTYNEDPQMLRATLLACKRMDYPHNTYVLDDGNRPAVKALAQELEVEYIARAENKGAKAGNLNHAMPLTRGEFVVIFDADHVPQPNFLTRLIGYFRDERMAMVQAPHVFYNIDAYQFEVDYARRRKWDEQEVFFHLIEPGRNYWNAVAFAGSVAIFRRTALEDIGLFNTATITEDLHTSLMLQAHGWNTVYHNEWLASGLAGKDVAEFQLQRARWAEGNLGILALDNPLTIPGLTLAQRLINFAAMFHWTGGIVKGIFLLTPIMMLVTGIPALVHFDAQMAVVVATNLVVVLSTVKFVGNGYIHLLDGDMLAMATFWIYMRAAFRASFLRRIARFIVTPKRGKSEPRYVGEVVPQLMFVTVSLASLIWGALSLQWGLSSDVGSMGMALFWNGVNLAFALWMIRRSLSVRDQRYAYRFPAFVPVDWQWTGPRGEVREGYGITADLNETGMCLVTYAPMPATGAVELCIRGPGEMTSVQGEIQWVHDLSHDGATVMRSGIRFSQVSSRQLDALMEIGLTFAWPHLLAHFERAPLGSGHRVVHHDRGERGRRQSERRAVRLPAIVRVGDSTAMPMHCVTEDVSRSGMMVELPAEQPVGTTLEVDLLTPLGEARARATVARVEIRPVGVFNEYLHGLQLAPSSTAASGILARVVAMVHGSVPPGLGGLWTRREPSIEEQRRLVPIFAGCLGFLAFAYGLFVMLYADSAELRAMARRGPGSEDPAAIMRIYQHVARQWHPDSMDLVLLCDMLGRLGKSHESAELLTRTIDRFPDDLGYRLRLADTLMVLGRFQEAQVQYRGLVDRMGPSILPSTRRVYLLAAARNDVRLESYGTAADLFLKVTRLFPRDPALREECAGVLARGGRLKEARAQYQALVEQDPDNVELRYSLIAVTLTDGDFAAAEGICKQILARGNDPERARKTLAEILTWKRDYSGAMAQWSTLASAGGGGLEIRARVAQLALWRKDYDMALSGFQWILDNVFERPDIWLLYLDAAASARSLGDAQRRTAVQLASRIDRAPLAATTPLSRLAWVLRRVGEGARSIAVLEKAIALTPGDTSLRLQLADTAHDMGKLDQAEDQYKVLLRGLGYQ